MNADDRLVAAGAREGYGEWVAGLASWTHFVTLTHDAKRLEASRGHDRVGVARHQAAVRKWFHQDVRRLDGGAVWWSEMEFHESGQPHEHGLLALGPTAPDLRVRSAWWDRAGFCKMVRIDSRGAFPVARYVAKYAGKSAAYPPRVWGFGVHDRETHSLAVASFVRPP